MIAVDQGEKGSQPVTDQEQIDLWVAGSPIHGVECCPDFSCCHADLLQPLKVRLAYRDGSRRVRDQLCARFLALLIKKVAPGKVLVVGPE